jgi:DNA-binding GntR family transcriptional regulator
VARTLRILALGADSGLWRVWLDGYRELLACLEAGDRAGAARRHRDIYRQFRSQVVALLAGGVTPSPAPA